MASSRPVPSPPRSSVGLERALQDLGAQVRRGLGPALPLARCATGIPDVDALLDGGVPRGRITEVTGPPSSGRTSLALALLAEATRRGELAVIVDAADAFDPSSAEAAGVALARVLWARARSTAAALRDAERALGAGGFALVLLDLGDAPAERALAGATWPRLGRAAAASETALVVSSAQRCAGPWSELALALHAERAHFDAAGGAPPLLTGRDVRVALARSRSVATGRDVALRLRTA